MLELLLASILLAPVVIVVLVNLAARRFFSPPVWRWGKRAQYALLVAIFMYLWGGVNMFAWDIEETCNRNHQAYDEAYRLPENFFPLSNRCNESYDLVPVYVNPAIVVLLSATAAFIGLAIRAARLNRRSAGERTESVVD